MGSKELVTSLIDKVDMIVDGGELIQVTFFPRFVGCFAFQEGGIAQVVCGKGGPSEQPPGYCSKNTNGN